MVGTGRKIPWRLPYLLSSITPAWYHPYVHFEVTIDTHCSQTMALFCRPAAQEFWERWQCSCRQNTSVATTVLKERFLFQRLLWGVTCPSFILSNKLSRGLMNIAWIFPRTKKILVMLKITNCGSATPPGDCIVISNCQYVVNFEFWNVKSRIVICALTTK